MKTSKNLSKGHVTFFISQFTSQDKTSFATFSKIATNRLELDNNNR